MIDYLVINGSDVFSEDLWIEIFVDRVDCIDKTAHTIKWTIE